MSQPSLREISCMRLTADASALTTPRVFLSVTQAVATLIRCVPLILDALLRSMDAIPTSAPACQTVSMAIHIHINSVLTNALLSI